MLYKNINTHFESVELAIEWKINHIKKGLIHFYITNNIDYRVILGLGQFGVFIYFGIK